MAKESADTNGNQQMFSADIVAAVLMASGTTSLSKQQYEIMSAIDGTRTASSFQHAFRAVLHKAKELKTLVDNGEVFTPVAPTNKRGTTTVPVSAAKKRKNDGDDYSTTPSKKAAPKTPRQKSASVHVKDKPEDDLEVKIPEDIASFIEAELNWQDHDV